jgi:hypothetical protein
VIDTYPLQNPRTAWRVYDGQAVIVSPDDSTLHTLNAVGTLVWEVADGRRDVAAIVARVCEAFDVAPERAEDDVRRFVGELLTRGLLTVSTTPLANDREGS